MEIEDFVHSVITQLDRAVSRAGENTEREVSFSYNSDNNLVEFDIAVTATSGDKKSGKAGIKVLSFAEGGGEITKSEVSSTVSRVKFGIRIAPQTKKEAQRNRQISY